MGVAAEVAEEEDAAANADVIACRALRDRCVSLGRKVHPLGCCRPATAHLSNRRNHFICLRPSCRVAILICSTASSSVIRPCKVRDQLGVSGGLGRRLRERADSAPSSRRTSSSQPACHHGLHPRIDPAVEHLLVPQSGRRRWHRAAAGRSPTPVCKDEIGLAGQFVHLQCADQPLGVVHVNPRRRRRVHFASAARARPRCPCAAQPLRSSGSAGGPSNSPSNSDL